MSSTLFGVLVSAPLCVAIVLAAAYRSAYRARRLPPDLSSDLLAHLEGVAVLAFKDREADLARFHGVGPADQLLQLPARATVDAVDLLALVEFARRVGV